MELYRVQNQNLATVVVEGRGQLEIVCPHMGKQSERECRKGRKYEEEEEEEEGEGQGGQQGQRYQKVRANLNPGIVFVVPMKPIGHPTVEIASRDENLQITCFEIRVQNNEKIFLAGRNNILIKMEREAKELAFDMSAREVDELLNAQREEAFIPGPGSRSHRGGGGGAGGRDGGSRGGHGFNVESILEVAARM